MKPLHFWVIGGDTRQTYLARALAEDGHRVHTYALDRNTDMPDLEGVKRADCVVLPLPAQREGRLNGTPALEWGPLLDALSPGAPILAGKVDSPLREEARRRGLTLIDYFDREELAVANAVPAAEGAIQIAMARLPITLHGAGVLIIGAGRIGKVLVQQLRGLGAHVALAARKNADLAWGAVWGCETLRSDRLGEYRLEGYDLVLNTVPAPVLGRRELERLGAGTLVIDLASAPGGTDFTAAQPLGIQAVQALGLPGKVAPKTAALALRSTLYHILCELGV